MALEQVYSRSASFRDCLSEEIRPAVALSRTKRLADVIIAVCALVFLLPGLFIIACAVAIDMKGCVLFTQKRGGIGGQPFRILKFRTMRVVEDGPGVVQATKGDPRVTRLGAFLRRSSLDELPQLINVIRGDMSLVGPRPHALSHDEAFAAASPIYTRRLHARPGLTGLAQVSGCRGEIRCDEDLTRRLICDIEYIEKWSLQLDLRIIVMTCFKAVSDERAY